MHSRARLYRLLPVLLLLLPVTTFAQMVTYCDHETAPFGDFTLTIPPFDIDDHPIMNAEILLTVFYVGEFQGENFDPLLDSYYGFGLDLELASNHLTGDPFTATVHIELVGEIPAAVGPEPSTISVPIGTTFWGAYVVEWDEILYFYEEQDLVITAGGMGGAYNTGGESTFSWSGDIVAEVCVTYTYDGSIPVTEVSFGALKALYR